MPGEMTWRAETTDETIRPEDEAAIRECLLDYFEGWFDGDPARMDHALHPGLAKHAMGQDAARSDVLDLTTKDEMVEATTQGLGRPLDMPDRAIRIEIASVSGNIACAVVHSAVYIEYALLVRTGAGWRITGALWRWAEGHGPRAV